MMRVLAFLILTATAVFAQQNGPVVDVVRLDGVVGPATARYVLRGLAEAQRVHAQALLIEIDTPGGLMKSMEDIAKALLASRVPTIVYVYPGGARAASAGVFITYAANIAAMATTTHLGAAHPVGMGPSGAAVDKTEMTKVTNDAAAEIRGFASRRGRNGTWAEQAVRESVSITDEQAMKLHVINVIADSPRRLLQEIDGWKVQTSAGERRLQTRTARMVDIPMDVTERFLALLSDPNVGLILMTVAMYGIMFELNYPAAVFPGVIGAIALILAFVSFAVVSVNVAGLAFIALSIILFLTDIKVPSHGILTTGGIASFFFGAVLLTEYQATFLRTSMPVIVALTVLTTAFFVFIIGAGVRAQRRSIRTGREALIGALGVARSDIAPRGTVFLQGSLWSAESMGTGILAGQPVEVVGIAGLHLKVRSPENA